MNKAKLFSSVFVAAITTFSLNAPAFACTDPSSDLNAPKQLANITTTDRVSMENGCFITMGSDLIKIVDNLGVASAAAGAGSGDKSDVFKFTWKSATRNVKLNTSDAQVKIYKDLGGGQRQLLVSSAQFSSSLSFSVAQNSAYLFEFYNSTQDGTHFQYTGIMN
jgi:hypothetical protein